MNLQITDHECIIVIGRRGYGKTTLVKYLHALIQHTRFNIIFDPNREYARPGYRIATSPADVAREMKAGFFSPGNTLLYQTATNRNEVADLVWLFGLVEKLRDTIFIVDELTTLLNRSKGALFDPLHRLVTRGRHSNVTLWGAAHRPVGIDSLFMSQCRIFVGPTPLKRDRDLLRTAAGDGLPFDSLRKFEFLALTDGQFQGKVVVNLQQRKIEYFYRPPPLTNNGSVL